MIISALGHIHETGTAYRDIKAENVVLDSDGKQSVLYNVDEGIHCILICNCVWRGEGDTQKNKNDTETMPKKMDSPVCLSVCVR